MRLQIDSSKVTELFFPAKNRTCPACGHAQRYSYKSCGRRFYQLDGAYYVDGQIVHCLNVKCPLRYKPMHPPGEDVLVPRKKGFGFDVIARIGHLRFINRLTRAEIRDRLGAEHPALVISERQVETLFKLYGELVTGTVLSDPAVIKAIRKNKALVLSIDGSKPMKDHESVWFVRDLASGITLAAVALTSCTTGVLVKLLEPIKRFATKHGVPVVGVVSDAESVIRAAVKKVFPRVRHQLCQFHYVNNLAKPLVKEDTKLRDGVKASMRDLAKIERAVASDDGDGGPQTKSQAELLQEVGEGIRSILRDNGEPPFEPPGLKLVANLTKLKNLVDDMAREKGGPIFGRSSRSSRFRTKSRRTKAGSAASMRISGM
jgi:hypothetical protein